MYSGEARWDEIASLVVALDVPVVGNGDIKEGEDAGHMKEQTNCAGVMIARGSHGYPWIFREARAALDGLPIPAEPDVEERFNICLEHIRNGIQFGHDADRTLIDFRKHLGWYTKGLPGGKTLRMELFQVTALEQVETLLHGYLEHHLEGAEAA